jgi:hypothetical protein
VASAVGPARLFTMAFVKPYFSPAVVFTICLLLVARATAQAPSAREESLTKFLQNYEGNPVSAADKTTRYSVAFVDLDDDGTPEALVYLSGPKWCGSGGCSLLILRPDGPSWKVITRTTVTQLPIRVLSTKTNGWHDLAVGVRGGGIQAGYEARLRFNGRKYPGNPSSPPAQKLRTNAEGKVVISAETRRACSL